MGFTFGQASPPAPMPPAIGYAYNLYSAWSNGQSSEPLHNLRDFILDRNNFSSIGNFSVRAVEARKKINCSAYPIEIIGDLHVDDRDDFNKWYVVAPSSPSMRNVQLRAQTQLTLWVDRIHRISDSRANTRVVFAALGGEIEGGYRNMLNGRLKQFCFDECWNNGTLCCSSISSLACDIDIELFDSLACNGNCSNGNPTLTSMVTLSTPNGSAFDSRPKHPWQVAAYMAAAPTRFGLAIYGRQRTCELSAVKPVVLMSIPY